MVVRVGRRAYHIVTVGTSLVRNAESMGRGLVPDRILEKFAKWARAPVRSLEDAEAGGRASEGTEEFEAALQILASDPYRASAELNAMRPYLEEGSVAGAALLSTDSGVAFFCASVIAKYLRDSGVEAEIRRVPQLGLDFDEGLYNLLDEAAGLAEEARKRGLLVYLNLTGGFKPEGSALYALAPLIGANRAYYVHEYTRGHVELPILPLTLDPGYRHAARRLHELPPQILQAFEENGIVKREGSEYRVRKWVERLLR
ncbi:putative CRISPR-associated protein [Infirmifilum lucidum]|uniref:Putative CRISPR-associated protein n=1 Tax=Infirmifilum lucidum TaxID=2776706 RepID=A0A7L9FIQ5_9CREN|nr:putative CRISPR-associated protein [Infirmifilum lucidum]QOJ78804.1 putative CRISPR-associated protein [Infirmifilum lucidum]